MATSSFDKEYVITDPDAVRKLYEFMASEDPPEQCTRKPYSYEDRVRCEELLRQYFSHSK